MLERRSEPQIIPSLRDGLVLHALQAINCLDFGELSRVATIIQSLRDARGYHSITPTRRHAHTPTRPHAHTPTRPLADSPIVSTFRSRRRLLSPGFHGRRAALCGLLRPG